MTENRYSKSKVYKLIDDQGFYYYGSTCLPLHKRTYRHKCDSMKNPQRKIYTVFTHERFLRGEIKTVLVEELNLQNKEQLFRAENNYIQNNLNDPKCLNLHCSFLTLERLKEIKQIGDKNYRNNNKEEIREQKKEYYQNNRDRLIEKAHMYTKNNKEKIGINKKEYYLKNKEKIAEYKKQYQAKNKNNEEKFGKCVCVCGSEIRKDCLKRHERSLKHLSYLNNIDNTITPFVETN